MQTDDQRQHVAAQQRIERQVEQIEGERLVEDRIVPGAGRLRAAARSGEADHRPGVDGPGGDEPGESNSSARVESLRVEVMLAEAGAGELEGARVRDPERGEGQQRGQRRRERCCSTAC